jgi:threonylcarbamoyladenosine tRNA methylthiotransferase MtaB
MQRVYVKTLGCKVNTFDSHALENQFRARGYDVCDSPDVATINILNTCSVTAKADKEARYLARRFRRANPDSLIVATGCYAQTDSAKLQSLDEIDLIVPNEAKEKLSELIDRYKNGELDAFQNKLPKSVKAVKENRQEHFKSSATLFAAASSSQTRAFLKVQDGCNGFCSYCLIPYARGQSRSVEIVRVLEELQVLAEAGTPEIVLTGIHIGDYGNDLAPASSLATLIREICERHPAIKIRISSLEPSEISDELLATLTRYASRICDHFHLPLQSGSDPILKLMGRAYSVSEYCHSVQKLRDIFPDASIGADIIPGFPGEDDSCFEQTLALCKKINFSYLHVFPYSKRPNTRAIRMPNHLEPNLIRERAATLRQLSLEMRTAFHRKFLGRNLEVLWENDFDQDHRRIGKTSNYLDVTAPSGPQPLARSRTRCELMGFSNNRLLCKPLAGNQQEASKTSSARSAL